MYIPWLTAVLLLAQLSASSPVLTRADSILNPLFESIKSLLRGDGLIEASLGALQGALSKDQEFDYVVVGGGTAGNAIGVRLAEAGFNVAIVEAGAHMEIAKPVLSTTPGGDIVGIGSNMGDSVATVDWLYQTEPQAGANNRRFHYAQGKCLGGSSALNFMIYHRGSKGTYDRWADLTGDDSYMLDQFSKYFKKSVNFTPPDETKRKANASSPYDRIDFEATGKGGPVQVGYSNWVSAWATWLEQGLKAVGLNQTIGFNQGNLLGYHYTQTTIRPSDATRSSSAQYIYSAGNQRLRNLKVFTKTQAIKVLFDDDKKATGATVKYLGITYTIKAKKEVILSAGAFKSPQLLMVSGIGPSDTLRNLNIPIISSLPGVGQNMWDHIFFGPSHPVNFPTLDAVLNDPIVLASTLVEYALKYTGPLASNVIEFIGWEKLPEKSRQNFSLETKNSLAEFPGDWPEVEYLGANGYLGNFEWPILQQPLDGRQYATILGAMVAPVSRGNVTIRTNSALDHPVINPNWLTAKADQEAAVAWFRRMREVWKTPELQSIAIDEEKWPGEDVETDEQILDLVRDSIMTVWHASCTCKMGKKDDGMAVVDNLARVYGVKGLRVVDASAMPLLPPGHPQSTIYALAEKIASEIVEGTD